MDRKIIAQMAGYVTLAGILGAAAFFLFGPARLAAPALVVLIFSGWLHGICWGYLYALEGRLTWYWDLKRDTKNEKGMAIYVLFFAIALFGALGYAFMQGSRGNVSMIEGEAGKAATYKSQDCTNSIDMAVKRLKSRGCGDMISYLNDGDNEHEHAPADGSCSVFHTNGGGAKPCDGSIAVASCKSGPIGTTCGDGSFYIGDMDGRRIYAAGEDSTGPVAWQTTIPDTSVGAGCNVESQVPCRDGLANTNAIIAAGLADRPAARACATKAPVGTWYLPAKHELHLLWENRTEIDLAAKGVSGSYWSSSEHHTTTGWVTSPNDGSWYNHYKTYAAHRVRCVRR